MSIFYYILARLEEPSTWNATGIGAILVHAVLPGTLGDQATVLLAAVGAFLGAALPEKK